MVSFDRKHLVGNALIEERSGLQIVVPATLLTALRRQEPPGDRHLL
jgi:hypothetical protein